MKKFSTLLQKISRLGLATLVLSQGFAVQSCETRKDTRQAREIAEITYDSARKNPELRQKYIDQLVRNEFGQELPQYVEAIRYLPDNSEIETLTNTRVAAQTRPAGGIGEQKKSVILVMPYAFEKTSSGQDLAGILFDHECVHAEHYFKGLPGFKTPTIDEKIDKNLFRIICELSAYRESIKRHNKRDISNALKEGNFNQYMTYYIALWNTQISVAESGRTRLQEFFFEQWMLQKGWLVHDKQGKYNIRVESKTGTVYLPLPDKIKLQQKQVR